MDTLYFSEYWLQLSLAGLSVEQQQFLLQQLQDLSRRLQQVHEDASRLRDYDSQVRERLSRIEERLTQHLDWADDQAVKVSATERMDKELLERLRMIEDRLSWWVWIGSTIGAAVGGGFVFLFDWWRAE